MLDSTKPREVIMFSVDRNRISNLAEFNGLIRVKDIRGRTFYVDEAKVFYPQYKVAVYLDAKRREASIKPMKDYNPGLEVMVIDFADELSRSLGWL
jgi:hypothetical protein